jgi:hypothetical protein
MKFSIAICLAGLNALALPALPAAAGDQRGHVVFLEVRNTDGLIYFALTGTSTGKPACAVFSSWTIPNENSESGKKLYALVLSARASGHQLRVAGTNTCVRWGDQEDVASIRITD